MRLNGGLARRGDFGAAVDRLLHMLGMRACFVVATGGDLVAGSRLVPTSSAYWLSNSFLEV